MIATNAMNNINSILLSHLAHRKTLFEQLKHYELLLKFDTIIFLVRKSIFRHNFS